MGSAGGRGMKARIYYDENIDYFVELEYLMDFIVKFGGLKPERNDIDERYIEYSRLSKDQVKEMKAAIDMVDGLKITSKMEPQDYEPLIFIEKDDKLRVSMAFRREENGDVMLSLQVSTSQIPVEVLGELTEKIDEKKLREMEDWLSEVRS